MKKRSAFLSLLFLVGLITSCGSSSSSLEKTKLATPTISKLTDDKVQWTTIENAISYDLDIDGQVQNILTTNYQVSDYGEYVFKVRARAGEDSNFLNSDWSLPFTLNYEDETPPIVLPKITAPIIDKQDYESIFWLPVDGAAGYRVYLNGTAQTPDLGPTEYEYSINGKAFGIYTLKVQTIPLDTETYSNSDPSNEIELEIIDPATFGTRLSLDIIGKPVLIIGDSTTYEVNIVDANSSDVSYLSTDVNWVAEDDTGMATISELGVLTGTEVGLITVKAALKDHLTVVGEQIISIITRPTLSASVTSYDKNRNDNEATITSSHAGKVLYYAGSEAPDSIVDFLNKDYGQADVVSGANTITIDIGKPQGDTINIYFLLEFRIDEVIIGYSTIFNLDDVMMILAASHVKTGAELKAALDANAELIILDNDINLEGVWARVDTIFTGVLEGNNHTINDLVLEGGGTGMIKTLGHGATFRNIKFVDPIAREFSGANDGIIASSIAKNATETVVTFENVALINAKGISSVAGSSRSTHGGLIGYYDNASDNLLSVRLTNVYIDYTHQVTRITDTANIGGLFGTFKSDSPNGIILNGVYLDIKVTSDTAKISNVAAIIGQGQGHLTVNNSVIKFSYDSPSTSQIGFELGYASSSATTTFAGENNLFIVANSSIKGSWPVNSYLAQTMFILFSEDDVAQFVEDNDFDWDYEEGLLALLINETPYQVTPGTYLDKPILSEEDYVISWSEVSNALRYEVYLDDVLFTTKQVGELTIDLSSLSANEYEVVVVAIGDNINYASASSLPLSLIISPSERLATPELTTSDFIVSWEPIEHALYYKVFVNDLLIEDEYALTNFDAEDYIDYGYNLVTVQAVANTMTHIHSFVSEPIEFLMPYSVTNATELREALVNNEPYIILKNNINLSGVWQQVSTVFTGTLDGDNYRINGLVVEGKETGMFKTLGNGATFKNIIFETAIAQNFTGASNGIIASTVQAGAQVTFDNFVLLDARAISSVSGSGRSTHAALIATYNNASDTTISIKVINSYINYLHTNSRSDNTANVGTIFGTFISGSPNGIIIEGSYFNVKYEATGGKLNNAGGLVGQGVGHFSITDTVIRYEFIGGSDNKGVDLGYHDKGKSIELSLTGDNNILIYNVGPLRFDWPIDTIEAMTINEIDAADLTNFATIGTHNWTHAGSQLKITSANDDFYVLQAVNLLAPSGAINGTVVSWLANNSAQSILISYLINDDPTIYTINVNPAALSYDFSQLTDGNYHDIILTAIGDQFNWLDSLDTQLIGSIVVDHKEQLATPVLEYVEGSLDISWLSVENATVYKIYVNGELIDTTTELAYELELIEYGRYEITVQAVNEDGDYYDSNLSLPYVYTIELLVEDQASLHDALAANTGYVSLDNDITLTGVWSQITTPFTGVLDGKDHKIIGLTVEGGATGMFKTLGNGATFKNIVFENATAQNFSGANDAIIASTMSAGAKITFENFALINGRGLSSVVGSSRSTHGGIIGNYNSSSDTTIQIRMTNVYIDYTHELSRNTDTANIGGIFGTFTSGNSQGLILESVYLDIKMVNTGSNKMNNIGAIAGTMNGGAVVNNTLISFMVTSSSTGPKGIDYGYGSSKAIFTGESNIFVSNIDTVNGTWPEDSYVLFESLDVVNVEEYQDILFGSTYWISEDDDLSLLIAGLTFSIF